ncbi:ATP-dependent DNA ligase [Patescibacteria group bacterium]|nr:ATP-dependent DNA ligase [Patescibacteria group bacterium]MBU1472982.1 ATP-dependent DNA ligase [Patescibacteria group bacterium]
MTINELAVFFQKLEQTSSRLAMTELLSQLFRKAGKGEIGKICYLLQGRVAPLYDAIEFGMAEKLIIRALVKAYGIDENQIQKKFKQTGDLGNAAQSYYRVLKPASPAGRHDNMKYFSIQEVYRKLFDLTQAAGEGSQEKKIDLLAELMRSLDPLSVRYIVRILLDKLRLGFSEMTTLDALSWMLKGNKSLREKLESAYNIRPDIGFIAERVKEEGIGGLTRVKAKVGAPILASLCQRLPTADEMIKKMGMVAVEPKYDGVRVQIHYEKSKVKSQKSKVKTFSRNLENTTEMFPELQQIGKQIKAEEVILDSEAMGIDPKTGRVISFQETMTRKRKHLIEGARQKVPLKFYVFDVLYRDGKSLLNIPLSERRIALEQIVSSGNILVVSPQIVTDSPSVLRSYHDEQIKKGLEGVVVKKWHSPYEPGRRGYSWVKFKEEGKTGKLTDTIDAVIMGYYKGEGKRAGFGIGAFLAGVRKGDRFVTITKIGTGVTDALWKELRRKLRAFTVTEKPKEYEDVGKTFIPDVWVAPGLVVEIAGDDLTKSSTHGAGIAVRFPRLVRMRLDKSPKDATTVAEARRMYDAQKNPHSRI